MRQARLVRKEKPAHKDLRANRVKKAIRGIQAQRVRRVTQDLLVRPVLKEKLDRKVLRENKAIPDRKVKKVRLACKVPLAPKANRERQDHRGRKVKGGKLVIQVPKAHKEKEDHRDLLDHKDLVVRTEKTARCFMRPVRPRQQPWQRWLHWRPVS